MCYKVQMDQMKIYFQYPFNNPKINIHIDLNLYFTYYHFHKLYLEDHKYHIIIITVANVIIF
jgi:hypothetical protein